MKHQGRVLVCVKGKNALLSFDGEGSQLQVPTNGIDKKRACCARKAENVYQCVIFSYVVSTRCTWERASPIHNSDSQTDARLIEFGCVLSLYSRARRARVPDTISHRV